MGRTVAIGLIAPQIPAELVEELAAELPQRLRERASDGVRWQVATAWGRAQGCAPRARHQPRCAFGLMPAPAPAPAPPLDGWRMHYVAHGRRLGARATLCLGGAPSRPQAKMRPTSPTARRARRDSSDGTASIRATATAGRCPPIRLQAAARTWKRPGATSPWKPWQPERHSPVISGRCPPRGRR